MKLFIYKSSSETAKQLVHKVLKWTTEEVDNPDLRDRGFMYWRLLAINPAVAGEIVLVEKPAITTDSDRMDRGALDQLLLHAGTLGSIYHKNPEVRYPAFRTPSKSRISSYSQTFIRGAAGRQLIDTPALNSTSRQMLVTVTRPNTPRAPVKVAGPGPVESHRGKKVPARSDTIVETGNLLGEDNEPNVIEDDDEEGEEEEDLNPNVKPEQLQDPYAGLDSAFGNKADEPQSAVSQISIEDELQRAQQQPQNSPEWEPKGDDSFQQSIGASSEISQLGL